MAKTIHKFRCKLLKNMGANDYIIEGLVEQMENDPLIYAYSTDPEGRNFMKWALLENIRRLQSFYDKITEIEKEYKLPLENED